MERLAQNNHLTLNCSSFDKILLIEISDASLKILFAKLEFEGFCLQRHIEIIKNAAFAFQN